MPESYTPIYDDILGYAVQHYIDILKKLGAVEVEGEDYHSPFSNGHGFTIRFRCPNRMIEVSEPGVMRAVKNLYVKVEGMVWREVNR